MPNTPRSADLHPGPGFQIRTTISRLDPALMQRFQDFEVADISDALNRLYALDQAITCLTRETHRLCGPACTVRVFPGDNLMVHKVLDVAKPGDIVVVDARGSDSVCAVIGDIICTKAKHRGLAGFVIDGLVRDLPRINQLDVPVFARGTTVFGPLHRGPGEINYPISCGGAVIRAGDVIVADISGIVAIPCEGAEDLLDRLDANKDRQRDYEERVGRGDFSNAWVDEALTQHGCPIEPNRIK